MFVRSVQSVRRKTKTKTRFRFCFLHLFRPIGKENIVKKKNGNRKKVLQVGPIGPTKNKNENAFSFLLFAPPPSNREGKCRQKQKRIFVFDFHLSLQSVEQKPNTRKHAWHVTLSISLVAKIISTLSNCNRHKVQQFAA